MIGLIRQCPTSHAKATIFAHDIFAEQPSEKSAIMRPKPKLVGEVAVGAFDLEIIDGLGHRFQRVRDDPDEGASVDVGEEVAGGLRLSARQ